MSEELAGSPELTERPDEGKAAEQGTVPEGRPRLGLRLLVPVALLVLVCAILLRAIAVSLPDGSILDSLGKDGKSVYTQNCASCHGVQGNRVPAAPLDSREFIDGLGSRLKKSITEGKGAMPAAAIERGGPLTVQQVRDVLEYLRSSDGLTAHPSIQAKELYAKNCASCHGDKGNRLPAFPLNSKEYLESLGNDALVEAIARGRGIMLAFGKERGGPLSAAEVQAVARYLTSVAVSTGPVANAAPKAPTTASDAKELYTRNCAPCHGLRGDQLPSPKLTSREFLAAHDDGAIARAIADGRPGMAAYGDQKGGHLSDKDIKALVAYLRAEGKR